MPRHFVAAARVPPVAVGRPGLAVQGKDQVIAPRQTLGLGKVAVILRALVVVRATLVPDSRCLAHAASDHLVALLLPRAVVKLADEVPPGGSSLY